MSVPSVRTGHGHGHGTTALQQYGPRRYLLQATVTAATAKRYRQCVHQFLDWSASQGEGAITLLDLDDLVLDYIHHLHESGGSRSAAACTLYGIIMYMPHLRERLHQSQRAVFGWNRLHPMQSYPPLTWELTLLIAVRLRMDGHHSAAIGVLLAFDCLLRISELCDLRVGDVADSGDARISTEHKGMIIRLAKTKTGPNRWVTVLHPLVIDLLRRYLKGRRSDEYLFGFIAPRFRRLFKNACQRLGLSPLYVPHSLRHGGATRYRHVLQWSVEDVLERGRWASTKSARIYIQSGPAVLLLMNTPSHILKLATSVAKDPSFFMTCPLP